MRPILFLVSLVFPLIVASPAQAAVLTAVSDTLGNSVPGFAANHTVKFKVTQAAPATGRIILDFPSFVFPSALDYSDVSLSVSGTSRPLALTAGSDGGSSVGVTVLNASRRIIFTLNDSDSISALSSIVIKIGTGGRQISNPSSVGSYRIHLATQNSVGIILDEADAMVAIVSSITVGASRVSPPPPIPLPAAPVGGGGGGGGTSVLFAPPTSTIIAVPPVVSIVATTTPPLIAPIEKQSLMFSTTSTVQIFNFPGTTTYKMGEKLVFSYQFKNINKKSLYIIINRQLVDAKGRIVRSISAQKNLKSGKSYLVNVKETLNKTLPAGDYTVRIKIVGPQNKILGTNGFVIKINSLTKRLKNSVN